MKSDYDDQLEKSGGVYNPFPLLNDRKNHPLVCKNVIIKDLIILLLVVSYEIVIKFEIVYFFF